MRSSVSNEELNDIQKWTLGKILKELEDLDVSDGDPYFSEADHELLNDIKDIRNYYAHECYAIVKGSYGEAERFNFRKLPKCAFVYLDGTWLPVRRRYGDGPDRYEKGCVMVALGITESGRKEVLGFWIGPSESAEGWENALKASGKGGSASP